MLVGPAMLLAFWAQIKAKSAYHQYSEVDNSRGCSGAHTAYRVLQAAEAGHCGVEETEGWLSDHYDLSSRVVRLSSEVFRGRSLAAVGIAAHEAGHAIQHASGYAMLRLRSALVPVVGIGSWLAWPMVFLGFTLQSTNTVQFGVVLFGGLVVFQAITLPVEFDASARAREALAGTGVIVGHDEADGVRAVLSAAAMTYVAATVTAVVQLVYFLLRFGVLGRSEG